MAQGKGASMMKTETTQQKELTDEQLSDTQKNMLNSITQDSPG